MNPPRFFNRLFGSLPGAALLLLVAGGLVYDWWIHQDTASGWLPIIALFVGGIASNARSEVTRYKTWKRSWDAMEGRPPPPRLHGLKAFGLMLLDVPLAYMVVHQLSATPPLIDPVALCLIAVITILLLYQLVQWQRFSPRTVRVVKPKAAHIITVSLPVAKPGPRPTIGDLPPYCQRLLQQQS